MAAPDPQWEADRTNSLRRNMFYFALATIFIRFSVIHEALAVALNLNLYLLYFVLPPTIFGIVATGGIRRTMRAASSRYWLAFLAWLFLATLFSAWRGGSAGEVSAYAKAEFLMLFVCGGLVVTWQECKLVMYTLALAGVTDLGIGRYFMQQDSNRVDLAMGGSTIGNANDLAAHLILMMSLLVYILVAPKIPAFLRVLSVPAIAYGIFFITSTASRGAMVALIACAIFAFIMGSSRYRAVLIAAAPIAVVAIILFLPRATLFRLSTTFSSNAAPITTEDVALKQEAEGSAGQRSELLKKSIQYTIQHPMFGVGPGQFSSYEGSDSQKQGKHGIWHQTHNSFTQISSECGIPALILFLCAIVSAFRLLLKTYRQARLNPVNADIAAAAFCMMLGIVGFLTAAFFLNLGYRFYEPAFCGLCIVLYTAAQHEMAARQAKTSPVPPTPLRLPSQPRTNPAPALATKIR